MKFLYDPPFYHQMWCLSWLSDWRYLHNSTQSWPAENIIFETIYVTIDHRTITESKLPPVYRFPGFFPTFIDLSLVKYILVHINLTPFQLLKHHNHPQQIISENEAKQSLRCDYIYRKFAPFPKLNSIQILDFDTSPKLVEERETHQSSLIPLPHRNLKQSNG